MDCSATVSFYVVKVQMVDEEVTISVEVENVNRVVIGVECGAPLI